MFESTMSCYNKIFLPHYAGLITCRKGLQLQVIRVIQSPTEETSEEEAQNKAKAQEEEEESEEEGHNKTKGQEPYPYKIFSTTINYYEEESEGQDQKHTTHFDQKGKRKAIIIEDEDEEDEDVNVDVDMDIDLDVDVDEDEDEQEQKQEWEQEHEWEQEQEQEQEEPPSGFLYHPYLDTINLKVNWEFRFLICEVCKEAIKKQDVICHVKTHKLRVDPSQLAKATDQLKVVSDFPTIKGPHLPVKGLPLHNAFACYCSCYLGIYIYNEPLIELDTPNPLFTDLSMVVILGNWNTTKISICKGDETGLDINFRPALAEVTDWLFPLCQYPMSGQCGAKHAWTSIMGGVRVFLQNCLDIKDTRKQQMCINQFISLLAGNCQVALTEVRVYRILHLTPLAWEAQPPSSYSLTLLLAMLCEVIHLTEHRKLLQVTTIWDLCQNIIELFSAFAQQGKSTIAWSHWDGITEQPALNGENPILALMPTSYSGETLGMAVECAASAPEVKACNVTVMCKIVDLISVPTFRLCQCEGGDMKLDAELKVPLQSLLMSLATVSVKKTLCIHEPTLDHSSGPLASKVQEFLTSLGYGINLQDLHFMDTQEAKEHWQEKAEQQHNLEKVALCARKFIKKPLQLLSKVGQDDNDDTPSAGPANYKHAKPNDGFHSDTWHTKQVKPTSVQLTEELLGTLHRMEDEEGDDTTN
ncbi:hypothetical protein EDC04DRAFT_3095955 [Pisolithus marmoratus]|nr:hypothetical protein EDC04DRAFT_3095955 [Pisolithus marmoratus]